MMSVSLSAIAQPTPQAKKHPASVRSGADLQLPASNVAPYTPLPNTVTTPTDAFTSSVPLSAPTAGMPVDPSAVASDADAASAGTPKAGFDPIAGAVGVAGIGLASLLLAGFNKEKGQYWQNAAKLFLAGGIGVGAAVLAPLGGNLVKDLLKKKPTTPAEPQPDSMAAAQQVFASPQVTDGSVPPAIDPMTGLPMATARTLYPAVSA